MKYEILPTHVHEFSDYNSLALMYNVTVSEIQALQKENRSRMKRLEELRKKYFDGAALKKEWVILSEQRKKEQQSKGI
jgi:hypothetical protein